MSLTQLPDILPNIRAYVSYQIVECSMTGRSKTMKYKSKASIRKVAEKDIGYIQYGCNGQMKIETFQRLPNKKKYIDALLQARWRETDFCRSISSTTVIHLFIHVWINRLKMKSGEWEKTERATESIRIEEWQREKCWKLFCMWNKFHHITNLLNNHAIIIRSFISE